MSREKALAKNTLIISFGTFLPKITTLVTIPILTSHLTKLEYGTYDLIVTLASLLLPIITLQIHSAAFRFLIDCRDNPTDRKRVITNIFVFIFPVSLVALIALFFILYQINILTRIIVLLYFFVDIIILTMQQVLRGLSNNKLYSISSVVQSFLNMLLVVITVLFWELGLNGVLLSFTIATGIGILVLFIKGKILREIDFSLVSLQSIKDMLKYSWPMIPNTLSTWVLSTSDRFVLTWFMGLEAVAVYAAANKIPQLFAVVQGTFVFAWQENASLAIADNDVEKYYSHMFDNIFRILTGIMSLLIASTPILFWLLIKGDYSESYFQMPILFMGMFSSALSSFLGGIYIAHKRTKSVGITTLLAAVCNLIIDFALVGMVGIFAASISTLVSYTLLFIYRMFDVKKFQKIKYQYKMILFCIAMLVGMCVLCWFNIWYLNIINIVFGIAFAAFINRGLLKNIWSSITNRKNKAKSGKK